MACPENKRFYRYILNEDNVFVGETAYHFDESRQIYVIGILVMAKYRGKGYGSAGLSLLCDCAKQNGIECLYDDIGILRPVGCLDHGKHFLSDFYKGIGFINIGIQLPQVDIFHYVPPFRLWVDE